MIYNKKTLVPILRLHALPGVGAVNARKIIDHYGSAAAFFEAPKAGLALLPSTLKNGTPLDHLSPQYLKKATAEWDFIQAHNIQVYYYKDTNYPYLLSQATDCPILLFGKGHLTIEHKKTIAVVGTRDMSAHGAQFCRDFIEEIAPLNPVIVSGFAKGVDICAQRAAVEKGLQTIGCLAHGLKHIYPAAHRLYIKEVMEKGGFFTEFLSDTQALRGHFVSRNRVIAGLSQATVVVESAKKGGSLHTAQLAESYNRTVFAVPGRPYDLKSEGCNNLIKHLKAQIITRARDLIMGMNWEAHPNIILHLGGPIQETTLETLKTHKAAATTNNNRVANTPQNLKHPKGRAIIAATTESLPEKHAESLGFSKQNLNDLEKQVYNYLFKNGKTHADTLANHLQWEIKKLYPILMTLELKDLARSLPGQMYEAI